MQLNKAQSAFLSRFLASFSSVLVCGCSFVSPSHEWTAEAEQLLSGVPLFGEYVAADELPDFDPLYLTPQIHDFVQKAMAAPAGGQPRFVKLLTALENEGYLPLDYSSDITLTAAEVFNTRTGNCLSFTGLFIAMARHAGIDARFQIVDVQPAWEMDANYLVRYTHINALVRGVLAPGDPGLTIPGSPVGNYSVDFNIVTPAPRFSRRVVSDQYALALFYSNIAFSEAVVSQPRHTFIYLKKAIQTSPSVPDLWSNLGAFYRRNSLPHEAIGAYQMALRLNRNNNAAISGLANAYYDVGEHALAQEYARRAARYRDRNPYYHESVAQQLFDDMQLTAALTQIERAISLEAREPTFWTLKARIEEALGDTAAARRSKEQAEKVSFDAQ